MWNRTDAEQFSPVAACPDACMVPDGERLVEELACGGRRRQRSRVVGVLELAAKDLRCRRAAHAEALGVVDDGRNGELGGAGADVGTKDRLLDLQGHACMLQYDCLRGVPSHCAMPAQTTAVHGGHA